MVDFIVHNDEIVLLEITPRPGGDCLPSLIRNSLDIDMFALTLDFAEGRTLNIPNRKKDKPLVGMRLFGTRDGKISRIDAGSIEKDQRVKEVYLKRTVGHRVILPPDDYDSRVLGHVIFEPESPHSIERECRELAARLELEMEVCHDQRGYGKTHSGISAAANPGT